MAAGHGCFIVLVTSKPIPDEFAPGFIHRLGCVNFESSYLAMRDRLIEHFGLRLERNCDSQALALLAGRTEHDFYLNHTQFPIDFAYPDKRHKEHYRPGGASAQQSTQPFRLNAPDALRFCTTCLEEQYREHRFPFWHRAHQLPGMYWCPWHNQLLRQQGGTSRRNQLPALERAVSALPPDRAVHAQSYPALRYFITVIVDGYAPGLFSARRERFNTLRQRAAVLGVHIPSQENQPTVDQKRIGELALEMLPAWWLEDLYGCSQKTLGKYLRRLDSVLAQEASGGWPIGGAVVEALLATRAGIAPA